MSYYNFKFKLFQWIIDRFDVIKPEPVVPAPPPVPTIVGIATGNPDFSILVSALQYVDGALGAGLVDTLGAAETDVTVFAPTNAAFGQLAADLGFTGDTADTTAVTTFIVGALPAETLRDVLLYHVSGGTQTAADIGAAGSVTTLQGGTIGNNGAMLIDQEPDLMDPTLVSTDIDASNGIVHVIDRVLLPIDIPGNEPEPAKPSIADIAAGDANFSILVAALSYVDGALGAGLVDTLGAAETDVTVFAPTNAAFGQLAADLGFTGDTADTTAVTTFIVGALPAETLRDVLLYHVSGGTQTAADIGAAGSVTTLQGGTIGNNGAMLIDQEPDLMDPTLVSTDIDASNGIVHVIDRVLLPIDIPGNEPEPTPEPLSTISGIVAASGGTFDGDNTDFDMLLNALQAANLVDALDDETVSLTAFAPTDAAFIATAKALGFEGDDETGAFGYIVEALSLLNAGDPIPLLSTILTTHVSPSALSSGDVLSATSISTLSGVNLGVDGASLVDADPDLPNAGIVATDIAASNGVVHVIDGVLLPADILQSDGTNDVDFIIASNDANHISTGRDNDFVDGNGGNDQISTGDGNDVVFGGTGNDKIFGERGDDMIFGGDGNDRLYGGAGNDEITGGAGHDVIYSGWGRDIFVYEQGDGHDHFADFIDGRDKIDLSDYGFASFQEVKDLTHIGWKSSQIELGDGDAIHVRGMNKMNIDESDFIL